MASRALPCYPYALAFIGLITIQAAGQCIGAKSYAGSYPKGTYPSPVKADRPLESSMKLTPGMARIIVRDLLSKRYLYARPKSGGFLSQDPGASYFESKNIKIDRDAISFEVDLVRGNKRETLVPTIKLTNFGYLVCGEDYRHNGYTAYAMGDAMPDKGVGRASMLFVFNPWILMWKDESDAAKFADAVNRLIYEAQTRASQPDALAAFETDVRGWKERPESRPKPPDGWDKYRILAEQAVKDADFLKALNNYEDGVAAYPLWAEGWFNAALLYDGLKEYEYAANRMRHYLMLMPDAPDAKAARNKIIVWEDKARQ